MQVLGVVRNGARAAAAALDRCRCCRNARAAARVWPPSHRHAARGPGRHLRQGRTLRRRARLRYGAHCEDGASQRVHRAVRIAHAVGARDDRACGRQSRGGNRGAVRGHLRGGAPRFGLHVAAELLCAASKVQELQPLLCSARRIWHVRPVGPDDLIRSAVLVSIWFDLWRRRGRK